MVIEVPQAIVGVLFLAHPGRETFAIGVGCLDNTTAPTFEIGAIATAEAAQYLRAQRHAMVGRAERDDVPSLRVRERQVNSGFGGLSTGDFVICSSSALPGRMSASISARS